MCLGLADVDGPCWTLFWSGSVKAGEERLCVRARDEWASLTRPSAQREDRTLPGAVLFPCRSISAGFAPRGANAEPQIVSGTPRQRAPRTRLSGRTARFEETLSAGELIDADGNHHQQ